MFQLKEIMIKYFNAIRRILKKMPKTRNGVSIMYLFILVMYIIFMILLRNPENDLLTSVCLIIFLFTAYSVSIAGGFNLNKDEEGYINEERERNLRYLSDIGLEFKNECLYEGVFCGYFIQIITNAKTKDKNGQSVDTVLFIVLYDENTENETFNKDPINETTKMGYIYCSNGSLKLIPHDGENPNFKNNLNYLIKYVGDKNFKPISIEKWKLKYLKNTKKKKII